jgi:glycerophosphoryl diester phosphodiesterase
VTRLAILAHRAGPDGRHPENSIAAARASARLGVFGIEMDLRLSRDGVFFVYHDEAVPGLGRISNLPAARLRRRLPTLDEFLPHASGVVYLDVKDSCPPRKVYRAVSPHLPDERIIVGSFWHPFIREVKAFRRTLRTAVTVEARLVHPAAAAKAARADLLAIEKTYVDRETVRAGVPVFAWTVNDPADARRLEAMGCAGIFTDLPSRIS